MDIARMVPLLGLLDHIDGEALNVLMRRTDDVAQSLANTSPKALPCRVLVRSFPTKKVWKHCRLMT